MADENKTMQTLSTLCLLFYLLVSILSGVSRASQCLQTITDASKVADTITVSQHGDGNFVKVQDAINSIPSGNNRWIRIYIHPGIYREQVKIPYDKQCIVLEGHSRIDTKIVFDGHDRTDTSSTFTTVADNFVAKNICFMNDYNFHGKGKLPRGKLKQAVAATLYGDKTAFYNCGFVGYQDTLWDVSKRHFFKSCYIEGAVDFIWGSGQSYYEDCDINVNGDGFITAQARDSPADPNGFVFERGSISGVGHAFLGRAYSAYSRVIFRDTQLFDGVNPLGWNAWHFVGHEDKFTYTEVNCTGGGADIHNRVKWEKMLDESELSKYTRNSFIDEDGWIGQQP